VSPSGCRRRRVVHEAGDGDGGQPREIEEARRDARLFESVSLRRYARAAVARGGVTQRALILLR